MSKTPDEFIDDYSKNESFINRYNEYQKRYEENVRESDRVLIEHVDKTTAGRGVKEAKVVDVGCSTGNFLKHLKRTLPDLKLSGVDLAEKSIQVARDTEGLEDIDFQVGDAADLPFNEEFDVVVTNAVTFPFDYDLYESVLSSICRSLKPGGAFIAFEFFHDFNQDLRIQEISNSHPKGLDLHFRPIEKVEKLLEAAGFVSSSFYPFRIGIDLERGVSHAGNEGGFEELNSYTRKTEEGERLLFRGALFQPWCHLVATKS